MAPEFAHLHVASSYSLRYGTATPAALAARAAGLGLPALALTDRDGLYGAFKHVQACADAGIKPLLGADLRLSPGGTTPRNPPMSRTEASLPRFGLAERVTLLAAGRSGWASLCRLVSAAHASAEVEAGDDAPAVTRDLIAEHAEGLVVLLGPASDVGQAVAARRPTRPGAPSTAGVTWAWKPSPRSSITWTISRRSAPPGWPSSPATPGPRPCSPTRSVTWTRSTA